MRIACDASALATPHNGIARYLAAILAHSDGDRDEWTLHVRRARDVRVGFARVRADGLPIAAGRLLSPWTTLPLASARRPPDLFWGPAHRLPVWLPPTTARVVTIHDLCWREAPLTMRRVTRVVDRWSMPRAVASADRIIAVSAATRDALQAAFPFAAERICVVHEGWSANAPDGRSSLPFDGRYVLAVGTLEPRKNLARLIEATSRLPGEWRLVVAGARGWGMPPLHELARTHGVAGRVLHLGPVDDATLATLYAHAEFLAMPSLYEGFGLPILESLAQGTPVLVGANSSMPEVAGDAGLAVDATSVDAIASGMARLLHENGLRAALAARAGAQAARFSWLRAARETRDVFDAAVAARRAR